MDDIKTNRARRRRKIRKIHFDLTPSGGLPHTDPNLLGFYFKNSPQNFNIGDPIYPGFTNLKRHSKRNNIGWTSYDPNPGHITTIIHRTHPFNVFGIDVCPANHRNMTIQIIGSCEPNSMGDPPESPDCKYWVTNVVMDADRPRSIILNPIYYRNLRAFIIRESPVQQDRDAKTLHPDAQNTEPLIGFTNIICKLTQEKYLDYPDKNGSYPN